MNVSLIDFVYDKVGFCEAFYGIYSAFAFCLARIIFALANQTIRHREQFEAIMPVLVDAGCEVAAVNVLFNGLYTVFYAR